MTRGLESAGRWRGRCAAVLAAMALACGPAPAKAQVSLRTVVELAERNSGTVRVAEAQMQQATASLAETRDVFIPSMSFGSGIPAFPEVGFTGALPTIWDASLHSMVFSMAQLQYIKAARAGLESAQLSLKNAEGQVTLDASTAYIELDAVDRELAAARQQEKYAGRLVEIEQQRSDAGVDPFSALLEAKLTAAQIRLSRLHLETRAGTLFARLAMLTGLPAGSIVPDHASIPAIPALTGDVPRTTSENVTAAEMLAQSKERVAKGDREQEWLPQVSFGAIYNRDTTLLNNVAEYYNTEHPLPINNFSSGFNIRLPLFDTSVRAQARQSAAEALEAEVQAQEAEQQNDVQIATLNGTLRELDAQADIASLKQQIAAEQLKTVLAQMELGNGTGAGAGAQPQVTPEALQSARIDERQKYEDALETNLDLSKARLNLLHALGHMQDWLNELQVK